MINILYRQLLLSFLFILSLSKSFTYAQAPTWQSVSTANPGPSSTCGITSSALDASGNMFVLGYFNYTVNFPTTTGNITLTSDEFSTMFVGKWSPVTSTWIWVTSSAAATGQGIAVNGSNVYVTGSFSTASVVVAGTTLFNSGASGNDIFVAKYIDNGTTFSNGWAVQAGSPTTPGSETGNCIAVNGNSVYVAGRFVGTSTVAGTSLTSNGGTDIFLAKYTDNGSSATGIWAIGAGGSAGDNVRGIAVNGSTLYIGGNFYNSMSISGTTLTSSGTSDSDLFLAKFTDNGSSAGNGWAVKGGGSGGNDFIFNIDANGNDVYFSGGFTGTGATIAGTTLSSSYTTDTNLFVAKYTDNGSSPTARWATGVSTASSISGGNSVEVSGTSVFVGGFFNGTATIAGTSLTSNGGSDAVLAKFIDNGSSVENGGAISGGGSNSDQGMRVNVSGNTVFLTGFGRNGATFGSYTLSSTGTVTLPFIARAQVPSSSPTITGFAVLDNSVCVGSPITFTATVGNVTGSYAYTVTNGTSTTTGNTSNTSFSQNLTASGSGSQSFSLIVNDNSQTVSASTSLTVNALPSLTINPTSVTLTNASPTASLSAIGTGNLLWSTGKTTSTISVTASGLYSVTLTSATGCKATASVPVHGSDLTTTLELPQANFAASGTAAVGNLVVNVFEVGGLPTSSGNVTITITAPIGYTLAFPTALTSIHVSGGSLTPVNNALWTVTNNLTNRQITLTMNSGAFIGAGGESSLGFTITRTSANSGSTANITVNVADDLTMTYDGNLSNNVYARVISGL